MVSLSEKDFIGHNDDKQKNKSLCIMLPVLM